MKSINFLVLVLFLVARRCQAKTFIKSRTPDQKTSNLVENLANIVTSCYGDQIHGIGLAGDVPDTLLRTLTTQHSIPVVVIDNNTNYECMVRVQFKHKLQIFIVAASSLRQFTATIQLNIRYSIWWNHMASFFILDQSPGCKKAGYYLHKAWKLNLLHAKVMCYGDKGEIIIKSFNPFTSLAPDPWTKDEIFEGKGGHPFTLFRRESRGSERICVNLDFEKMKNLGGYQISVGGTPLGSDARQKNRPSVYQYIATNERILDNVYRALNVTPLFTGRFTNQLVHEDMLENPDWTLWTWDTRLTTSPHLQTGFVLVSQFRGNKSQLNKILSVIDVKSRIGMGVVYLFTLIFFKFIVQQALAPALLNLIRITCGSGFANVPTRDPPRIYLAGILFFAVTMHGIFEGNLASRLTTLIPLPNVNTMQDLSDFGYTIYGTDALKHIVEDPELKERFIAVQNVEECIERVRQDQTSTCITYGIGETLDFAREFDLHVSGEYVVTTYLGYDIRWTWPLEDRINILLSRMVEADALEPWDVKCTPIKLGDFQFSKEVKKNQIFKTIELGELTFAFVILGIGLVLATITFIGELLTRYRCKCLCRIVWERRGVSESM